MHPEYESHIKNLKNFLNNILITLAQDDVQHSVFTNSTQEINRRVNSFMFIETNIAKVEIKFLNYYFSDINKIY